jgi:two-component system, sensor histidine kinase and response regulator
MSHSDIMIVDDSPANLKLLEEMLLQQGHEVRSFPLGRLALSAAMRHPPDLILLDIDMPEMNGYEVCDRLKGIGQLADVPVMFLSALNETPDKVRAFRSGAVDYVSRPFQFEEVRARVETHLKLYRLQRALRLQNVRLEEAVAARTRELDRAYERLKNLDRSKNEFLSLISHEFRTPLNGLLGVGDLILEEMPPTKENRELREMFVESRRRILSILDDALLLTQIDVNGKRFGNAPVCLHRVLERAIDRTIAFAGVRHVRVSRPGATPELVEGDEELLVRALHALLETAVKFSGRGETVRIASGLVCESPSVFIETWGGTIPNGTLAKFFDVFAIGESSTPGGDLGLGPSVAYRILASFGASVSVANRDRYGILLTVSLKTAESNEVDRSSLTASGAIRS